MYNKNISIDEVIMDMPLKIYDKFKYASQNAEKVNKKIKIEKESFNEEWNKWGVRKINLKKIP